MYILHRSNLLPELNRLRVEDEAKLNKFMFAFAAVVEGDPNPGEHTTPELAELRELLVRLRCATRVGAPDELPMLVEPASRHED